MLYDTSSLIFLSTLSLRRATWHPERCAAGDRNFYPRSPCGERLRVWICTRLTNKFLSTLSLRRATRLCTILYSCPGNFYPRSPCGERPQFLDFCDDEHTISIHALLAESDLNNIGGQQSSQEFLSTLSLRRATSGYFCFSRLDVISIHALLAESDPLR